MAKGNMQYSNYPEWIEKFSEWFDGTIPQSGILCLFLENKGKSLEEISIIMEKERWSRMNFRQKLDETAFYLVPIYDFVLNVRNSAGNLYEMHFYKPK